MGDVWMNRRELGGIEASLEVEAEFGGNDGVGKREELRGENLSN